MAMDKLQEKRCEALNVVIEACKEHIRSFKVVEENLAIGGNRVEAIIGGRKNNYIVSVQPNAIMLSTWINRELVYLFTDEPEIQFIYNDIMKVINENADAKEIDQLDSIIDDFTNHFIDDDDEDGCK